MSVQILCPFLSCIISHFIVELHSGIFKVYISILDATLECNLIENTLYFVDQI